MTQNGFTALKINIFEACELGKARLATTNCHHSKINYIIHVFNLIWPPLLPSPTLEDSVQV